MGLVVCKLPRAGLGNQLFSLMKAYSFAHLNNLPVIVTDYHQVKFGVYLRGEKSKRKYTGYFNFQKNMIAEQLDKWRLRRYKKAEISVEPAVIKMEAAAITQKCYLFSQMPHWDDYFAGLKDHRVLVIKLFWNLITREVRDTVEQITAPIIGVHIRMGDFRKLKEGEDFSKLGAVRTPEQYFIDAIAKVRKIHGEDLPVSVFTDGYKREFDALFNLKNITLVEGNRDIVDLLLLSKSKIIICSAGSTFSYWAGFLSESPLILHPDHIHAPIRKEQVYFEGTVEQYVQKAILNDR